MNTEKIKYLQHKFGCGLILENGNCTCGLDKALSELKAKQKQSSCTNCIFYKKCLANRQVVEVVCGDYVPKAEQPPVGITEHLEGCPVRAWLKRDSNSTGAILSSPKCTCNIPCPDCQKSNHISDTNDMTPAEQTEFIKEARELFNKSDKCLEDEYGIKLIDIIDNQAKEIDELKGWKDLAKEETAKVRAFAIKHKLGLGGENIFDLVVNHAESQTREIKEVKHVLFETVIAPNCPTCSNQMSNHCDNGQICMSKLLNAEFVRFDQIKMQQQITDLEAENARLKEALEKLACLGNGDYYGNSEGNVIAQQALKECK